METWPLSAWRPEGQWQSSWFWDNFRCHAELEAVYADLTKPFDWRIGREEYRRSLFSYQSVHCWCCGRCYLHNFGTVNTSDCSLLSFQYSVPVLSVKWSCCAQSREAPAASGWCSPGSPPPLTRTRWRQSGAATSAPPTPCWRPRPGTRWILDTGVGFGCNGSNN